MRAALAVAALSAAVLGLGLTPGAASADVDPDVENYWSPTEYALGVDDPTRWVTAMSSSGKGVVFSGGSIREYDATTRNWGAWTRLHGHPERLRAKSNARGDVCTAWSNSSGIAIACRTAGSQAWPKTRITTSGDANLMELAISTDGKRALVVWEANSVGRVKARATIYTLGTQGVRTTRLQGIPDAVLQYTATPTRLQRTHGFALAIRTGVDRLWGNATYYRLYRPGGGWSAQQQLRLGTPERPVLLSSMASDGIRTYAAVTPDVPDNAAEYPGIWWVTELKPNGTFTPPEPVPGNMSWPIVAASRTSVTLAGVDPEARDSLVISRSFDFIDSAFRAESIPSPRVANMVGVVTDLAIVGQRDATEDDGYALMVQYSAASNPSILPRMDIDHLYTLTGFDTAGTSALKRLGSQSGDGGMSPAFAGFGRYAMTAYSGAQGLYAGVRVPFPL